MNHWNGERSREITERNIRNFNRQWSQKFWRLKARISLFDKIHRETALYMLKRVGVSLSRQTVLDVGFGNSDLLFSFSGGEICGYDISVSAVENATWLAKRRGIKNFRFTTQFEFDDDYFDLVIMSHVLEHIPNPWMFLKEKVWHVLRNGGYLLVIVPANEPFDNPLHIHHFDDSMVLCLRLNEAGFSVINVLENNRLLFFIDKIYAHPQLRLFWPLINILTILSYKCFVRFDDIMRGTAAFRQIAILSRKDTTE